MPSKTFFNLDKDKQNKLIEISLKEFASYKYPDVSINKIINKANIPRGSFYMYFQNKEELFDYIIELKTEHINKLAKETMLQVHGNLKEFFIKIFEVFIKNSQNKENMAIMKNILIFNRLRAKQLENPNYKLFQTVKDDIDTKLLKNNDLEFIFCFLSQNLFFALGEYSKTEDYEKVKNKYLKKLDIIFYGIYK